MCVCKYTQNTYIQDTHRQTCTNTDRQRQTTHTQTDAHRQTCTNTDRQRQTTHTQTDAHRQTHTHSVTVKDLWTHTTNSLY